MYSKYTEAEGNAEKLSLLLSLCKVSQQNDDYATFLVDSICTRIPPPSLFSS